MKARKGLPSRASTSSPGEENRDLTGKYVLKGQVEAGFSRSRDPFNVSAKVSILLAYDPVNRWTALPNPERIFSVDSAST
jgi:hypothetical protein